MREDNIFHTFDDRDADLDFAVPESDPELLERDRDLDLDGDLDLELDFESSLKERFDCYYWLISKYL